MEHEHDMNLKEVVEILKKYGLMEIREKRNEKSK